MKANLRALAWSLGLVPLAWLAFRASRDGLGANPVEYLIRFHGDWALRFLLMTLAVTPLLRWWPRLGPARRTLGQLAFVFAVLHLLLYLGLDKFFDAGDIWRDIVKRRYITVGMLAFLLILPLAITSTDGWIKRLGGKRWKTLHKRLVWPLAFLACLHFAMMIKFRAYGEPLLYTALFILLLGMRFQKKGRIMAGS